MGAEASDDPAGTLKTFGDVWVATFDNPRGPTGNHERRQALRRSVIVAKGVSAPYLLGKFNDKTAIEADRTEPSHRQRLLLVVAIHGQRRGPSTSRGRPTTALHCPSR